MLIEVDKLNTKEEFDLAMMLLKKALEQVELSYAYWKGIQPRESV